MAVNRLDTPKTEQAPQSGPGKTVPAEAPPSSIKTWMPLIANIILMPVIAYGLTTFVLIPKMSGVQPAADSAAHSDPVAHGSTHGAGAAKSKVLVPLSGKVLVNVAGTAGTRYLVANITLVGKAPSFKTNVEEHDPELRDSAASILSGKTISDLEKPGMRNLIRAELISSFNDVLGKDAVSEIFLTEFAIQ